MSGDPRGAPRGLVIAGTHSGVGKTTVSFALMSLLTDAGIHVQPFKVGPDFIDTGYHHVATGRRSINLDLWMMGASGIRDAVDAYGREAGLCVAEGIGGLYDGEDGTDRGSTAHVARALGWPVLLVVDVWGMTRSAVAVLRGFEGLDPEVDIAAVVLNRVGSEGHYRLVMRALPPDLRRRVVGYVLASSALGVPERHLGLLTVAENRDRATLRDEVIERTGGTLDLPRLQEILGVDRAAPVPPRPPRADTGALVRIGVAHDEAFCFYYDENLRMLEDAGATLVRFSPLRDERLPEGIGGVYLGGGYPESFAAELAANVHMHAALRELLDRSGAIYAECGGLMYLARALVTADGTRHDMAGLVPLTIGMDPGHLAICYAEVEMTTDTVLGPRGTRVRGQEFHQSRVLDGDTEDGAYRVLDSRGPCSAVAVAQPGVLASYVHVHFRSNPDVPRHFVRRCAEGP